MGAVGLSMEIDVVLAGDLSVMVESGRADCNKKFEQESRW